MSRPHIRSRSASNATFTHLVGIEKKDQNEATTPPSESESESETSSSSGSDSDEEEDDEDEGQLSGKMVLGAGMEKVSWHREAEDNMTGDWVSWSHLLYVGFPNCYGESFELLLYYIPATARRLGESSTTYPPWRFLGNLRVLAALALQRFTARTPFMHSLFGRFVLLPFTSVLRLHSFFLFVFVPMVFWAWRGTSLAHPFHLGGVWAKDSLWYPSWVV
ncbi:hypothetical protein NMY22_g10677 [Coprinellus aureogranulatus]|nr:hypothetical protein NMY22_g10677 [Coprinellus aureogranulatus]